MSPKISLVICAWNRADYVATAIKSVLNQTRGDFELIVWDDGSTDDSIKIARETSRNDSRVRVIAGEHQGLPLSVNAAAKMLSAPYFAWVDSDDILHESALKETAAILDARPEIGLVYTDYQVIDEKGTMKGLGHRCKIPYSKDRLLVDFMTFHFRLMRRELFDAVGQLDASLGYAEDYDLCLRMSEVTEIHHLAKPLYYYRSHRKTISQQRRFDQIETSARAVRNAMARRGMDQTHELEVEYRSQFHLRKKGEGKRLKD
ncbi:MAG TPA: glycosyltransferase [Tepidisphaeraceae bacterium]|jgi:glycosyltransferase involved in cell wall biosynthesis|nr:glycosyltransferase [Tepidisphaeraceae bacterium]